MTQRSEGTTDAVTERSGDPAGAGGGTEHREETVDAVGAEETSEPAGAAEATGATGATPEERRALFRVIRGEPTDAEVAALTVVLAAAAAASGEAPAGGPRSAWNDPVARLRVPLHPGPGAWAMSAWRR
ncbi:acyl-CoA carboxylase subunit epsilon [Pseudonocardia sp. H11422]|uniref:acyl-CoA carboxylase subunit epsilon n=1 Tax=Pseudonocardia sp. H11422 TaxID=2835866 RepID=UPI0027E288AC|nr:acyl-CoA carboxylase subunit epsilon [Pseudonocardia sp. H11422]